MTSEEYATYYKQNVKPAIDKLAEQVRRMQARGKRIADKGTSKQMENFSKYDQPVLDKLTEVGTAFAQLSRLFKEHLAGEEAVYNQMAKDCLELEQRCARLSGVKLAEVNQEVSKNLIKKNLEEEIKNR